MKEKTAKVTEKETTGVNSPAEQCAEPQMGNGKKVKAVIFDFTGYKNFPGLKV